MADSTPSKRCTKCGIEYPGIAEYFQPSIRYRCGFVSRCRLCCRKQTHNWYDANRRKMRETVPEGLKRCSVCGELKPATTEFFYWRSDEKSLRANCKLCVSKTRVPTSLEDKKKYYVNHSSQIKAHVNEYRRNNPEKIAACKAKYRLEHPEKLKVGSQRHKARKRLLRAELTDEQWIFALDYFNNHCAVCGRPPGLWHKLAQDHWIPVAKGGEYICENIVPLCNGIGGCNQSKADKDAETWLISRYGKRKASKIIDRIQVYFEKVGK